MKRKKFISLLMTICLAMTIFAIPDVLADENKVVTKSDIVTETDIVTSTDNKIINDSENVKKIGDANNDNTVNSADALLMLQCSVGKVKTDMVDSETTDVNADGDINATDALLTLQYSVDKIEYFSPSADHYLLPLLSECKWLNSYSDAPEAVRKMAYDENYELMTMTNIPYFQSFELWRDDSYAVFNLDGKYNKVSFALGHCDIYNNREDSSNYYYNGGQFYNSVMSVYGDGVKIGEYLVKKYSLPQNIILDVTGVKELKFEPNNSVNIEGLDNSYFGIGALSGWTTEPPMQAFPVYERINESTELITGNRDYIYSNKVGNSRVADGVHNDLNVLRMVNKTYDRGLSLEGDSGAEYKDSESIFFNLKKQFKYINFLYGNNQDEPYDNGSILSVFADGKLVFDEIITADMLSKYISIEIDYAANLEFNLTVESDQHIHYLDCGIALLTGSEEPVEYVPEKKLAKEGALLISQVEKPYYYPDAMIDGWGGHLYEGGFNIDTMTMASVKYNEGFLLSPSYTIAGVRDSYACFNLDGVYKTMTFTAGHIDGSPIRNYVMKILGDDKLIKEISLTAFALPMEYSIDVTGVSKLVFIIEGFQEWYHGIYGIADIAVYSGDVTTPAAAPSHLPTDLPVGGSLNKNFKPYEFKSHAGDNEKTFFDGKSSSKSFTVGGQEKNEGMILEANISLDIESVSPDAMIVSGLAIIAAGSAYKKGYAAYNLFNKYKTFKFKVQSMDDATHEQILTIAGDENILLEQSLETGKEYEFEIDLNNCGRLGILLGGEVKDGAFWGGKFAIYDMQIS